MQEFNKGVYDYIIATDESSAYEGDEEGPEQAEEPAEAVPEDAEEDEVEEDCKTTLPIPIHIKPSLPLPTVTSTQRDAPDDAEPEEANTSSKKRKRAPPSKTKTSKRPKGGKTPSKNQEKEYGVTRGVDFIDVSCVLNFDLPTSARAYTHRVGRTARAGRTGMALSFIVPKDEFGKNHVVGSVESTRKDEKVFERIERGEKERGTQLEGIKEYKFDMKQVEAFRYRMEDALRSVTKKAIQEARVKELKSEILNSEKLKVCLVVLLS